MALLLFCFGGFFIQSQISREEGSRLDGEARGTSNESGDDLDHRLAASHRVSEARKRIAWQVLTGQLSLLQAAQRYQDLNESYDGFSWENFRMMFPGGTDDERVCRQVIQFVQIELSEDSQAGKLPATKLERELADLLRRGKVHLQR
jgi:hypothetical protein